MILDQIVDKLKLRLEAITTGNGYPFDVETVVIPKRGEEPELVNYGIAIESSVEPRHDLDLPGNPPAVGWQAEILVDIFVTDPGDKPSLTAKTEAFGALTEAISKPTGWYAWDGLAIDSQFGQPDFESNTDGSNDGIQLTLMVEFRTDENNFNNPR